MYNEINNKFKKEKNEEIPNKTDVIKNEEENIKKENYINIENLNA